MKPMRSKSNTPKPSNSRLNNRPGGTQSHGSKNFAVKRRPRGTLWHTADGESRFSFSLPTWLHGKRTENAQPTKSGESRLSALLQERLQHAKRALDRSQRSSRKSVETTSSNTETSNERRSPSLTNRLLQNSQQWADRAKSMVNQQRSRRKSTQETTPSYTPANSSAAPENKRHGMGDAVRAMTQRLRKRRASRAEERTAPQRETSAVRTNRAPVGKTLSQGVLWLLGSTPTPRPTTEKRSASPAAPRPRLPMPVRLPRGVPNFLSRRTHLPVPTLSPESLLKRFHFLLACFVFVFLVLAYRAVDLTVIQHSMLKEKAQNQYRKKVVVPAYRGRIMDRNGKTLSVSLPVKSLSVDVDRMEDPDLLSRQLAPLIQWPEDQLRQRLKSARKKSFPVLQHQLTPMVIHRIQQLDDPALFLTPEVQRFYPVGEITSHILGFTDFDGHGVEGLERSMEKELRGKAGESLFAHDRLGRPMPTGKLIEPAQPGSDLVLTIDTNIQYIAYRTLLKGMTKTQAKGGVVIVMNPENGEIYAMVNQPGFNPNNLGDSKADDRRNRAIADAYEPGSTFKTFTVSAALDLGLVKPSTAFDVHGGTLRIGGRTIRDFHQGKRWLTVEQILETSSNVGAAKIGLLIGNANMDRYISSYGFGKSTRVGFSNESPGSVPDITAYRIVGLANRSYGYGITATPLQIATATAAAINGGMLYKPQLIAGRMVHGKMIPSARPEPHRVIKPETSATMRQILALAVGPEGTAPQARVEGYTVAGKTGTARKAIGNQGYVRGHYFSSFVGFVPADKPKLLIYVGIDEPKGVFYGGLVAAPIFREIAQEVLPLLSIFPENRVDPELPALLDAALDKNHESSKKEELHAAHKPEGKTPLKPENKTAPKTGEKSDKQPQNAAKNEKKGEKKGDKKGEPEPPPEPPSPLLQLSLADALEQLKKESIVPRIEGHGRVVRVEKSPEGETHLFLE
ncbi:MAG: penicillin-binding protein 2 [Magnetococcales bacterium]|nr:penicillin-binding protein 2 [Magnetococcales bacterium]MBF0113607.1 penicillin-binding protein 2 [Magnetococcales bacterium]